MIKVSNIAAALGRIPSGLFILTAGQGDAATGMLASWVQQCSLDPPQISVAVQRDRNISTLLVDNATFVVNVVAAGHTQYLRHFGKGFGAGQPAFQHVAFGMSDSGIPVLAHALAFLECKVVDRISAGDHDLVIGRVHAGQLLKDDSPAVHIRKSGLNY